MNHAMQEAIKHWHHVAPLLTAPTTKAQYKMLSDALDELLDQIGDDETHPLAALAERMGDLIATYEATHYPIPDAEPREVLRFLMQEHNISQSGLPEIGAQSVVSAILSGKRTLNARQIKALAQRFGVKADVFL